MSDVDDILQKAGAGLDKLLQTPGGPKQEDVYRKAQAARLPDFDALLSTLRGPTQPEEVARPQGGAAQPATPLFPKPPVRFDGAADGIAAPTLPQNAAPIPNDFQPPLPAGTPPLVVKRLERPR
jgi:hypothetical protein